MRKNISDVLSSIAMFQTRLRNGLYLKKFQKELFEEFAGSTSLARLADILMQPVLHNNIPLRKKLGKVLPFLVYFVYLRGGARHQKLVYLALILFFSNIRGMNMVRSAPLVLEICRLTSSVNDEAQGLKTLIQAVLLETQYFSKRELNIVAMRMTVLLLYCIYRGIQGMSPRTRSDFGGQSRKTVKKNAVSRFNAVLEVRDRFSNNSLLWLAFHDMGMELEYKNIFNAEKYDDVLILPKNPEKHDYLFRILMLGPSYKDYWYWRFDEGRYDTDRSPTIGFDFCIKFISIKSTVCKLRILNEAHGECFRIAIKSYYRDAGLYILFFDAENQKNCSFKELQWYIEKIDQFGNRVPGILVALRMDALDRVDKSAYLNLKAEVLAFAKENDISRYIECSAKENINVDCVGIEAAKLALEHAEQRQEHGPVTEKSDPYHPTELIEISYDGTRKTVHRYPPYQQRRQPNTSSLFSSSSSPPPSPETEKKEEEKKEDTTCTIQ